MQPGVNQRNKAYISLGRHICRRKLLPLKHFDFDTENGLKNAEKVVGRHVCRTKLPPKNFLIDTKNGLKNAKKDPKNDPKRV